MSEIADNVFSFNYYRVRLVADSAYSLDHRRVDGGSSEVRLLCGRVGEIIRGRGRVGTRGFIGRWLAFFLRSAFLRYAIETRNNLLVMETRRELQLRPSMSAAYDQCGVVSRLEGSRALVGVFWMSFVMMGATHALDKKMQNEKRP